MARVIENAALAEPNTRAALRRYRQHSAGMIGVGVGAVLIAEILLIATGFPDGGPIPFLVIGGVLFGALAICGGLLAFLNGLRIGHVLRTHPWVRWDASYREVGLAVGGPNGEPALVLGSDPDLVLTLVAFKWRWSRFSGLTEVWLAGSPRHGGVVSPVGGEYLVWCRRPRLRWFRRLLGRRVDAQGSA